jgi:elongator complex protein 3
VAGNKRTNFRQIAEAEIKRRGRRLVEIRQREIRDDAFDKESLELIQTEYVAGSGREIFFELVTDSDRIVGFLRLSLPTEACFIQELGRNALVRELHVYGASVAIGAKSGGRAQHRGFGARLLDASEAVAREAGYETLSVISAIGTRNYYRDQRFSDGILYQHRAIG